MKTLAVIPARLGATRLPRKPLRLLGGAPLVVRVWERVVEMRVADAVVVATDAEEIGAVIRERGGQVVQTRPDHPSGTDRVAEVAARPEFQGYSVIVNVQGDEPFMSEEAVRGAVTLVRSDAFPLATAAARAGVGILGNANVVKVVCGSDGRALYFSRAAIPHLRDSADGSVLAREVRQHIGLYVYSRDALFRWVSLPVGQLEQVERLEQLRPLAAGIPIGVHVVSAAPPAGIDTEEDLARANALWLEHFAERS